jgi:hypothetical protein
MQALEQKHAERAEYHLLLGQKTVARSGIVRNGPWRQENA